MTDEKNCRNLKMKASPTLKFSNFELYFKRWQKILVSSEDKLTKLVNEIVNGNW